MPRKAMKRDRLCPLEVKILSSLHIIGRGATYDDDSVVTYISLTEIATFFHLFIVWMATLNPFLFTSVVYKVSFDHSSRILSVTAGHYDSRIDKTSIQFDRFIQKLQSSALYLKAQFDEFNTSGGMTCTRAPPAESTAATAAAHAPDSAMQWCGSSPRRRGTMCARPGSSTPPPATHSPCPRPRPLRRRRGARSMGSEGGVQHARTRLRRVHGREVEAVHAAMPRAHAPSFFRPSSLPLPCAMHAAHRCPKFN